MIRTTACLIVMFAATVIPGSAQTEVPQAGLRAEQAGQWQAAIAVYRERLATGPARADLWVRIADLEAQRGDLPAAITALEQAVHVAPQDVSTWHRLSQAHALAGDPSEALAAIEQALALTPGVPEYLRAQATLATWAGQYHTAARAYRDLREHEPGAELDLALARVYVWEGDTDEAVAAYRRYLAAVPDEAPVWIELATAESWRGNYGASLAVLDTYRDRFGETPDHQRTRATVLAHAGKPSRALAVVDPLLEAEPDDYELNFIRTVAFASKPRRSAAYASLERIRLLAPTDERTQTAERIVRAALASTAGPEVSLYRDSDGLERRHAGFDTMIALPKEVGAVAGYEEDHLTAPLGSGLEHDGPDGTMRHQHGWIGATHRLGVLSMSGRMGRASTSVRNLTSYRVEARIRPADAVTLSVDRGRGFFLISPRTLGLGLTRVSDHARVEWTPGTTYSVLVDLSRHELSDDNRIVEIRVAPQASVLRREALNLDVGLSAYQYRVKRDLPNGYYDPRRYEFYGALLAPYWKASESNGLSATAEIGLQRDETSDAFRLGGNGAVDLTFGIFREWVLNVGVAATLNGRLESGAFRGFRTGATLTRRF